MGAPQAIVLGDMSLSDVEGVLAVERQSFLTPWSRAAFVQELTENIYAHYVVARDGATIAGYAGMWIILDEAHVTNVAVHPDYRGRSLGRRLMHELMHRAIACGARRMTLEVRVGNAVARSLYTSLGFKQSGVRPNYYTDTHEDALIMWLDPLWDPQPAGA